MSCKCNKCGSEFEDGTEFCTCGNNLQSGCVENMICPKCRVSYPSDIKFCVNDGSKLVREEDLIPRCLICNKKYPDNIKFCPIDGGKIRVVLPDDSDKQNGTQDHAYNTHSQAYNNQNNGYDEQNQFGQPLSSGQKYPKADLGYRLLAWLLDGLIMFGLSVPGITFLSVGIFKAANYHYEYGVICIILGTILIITLPFIYNLIKDGLGEGQSWGKKACGLMVINIDTNSPCNKGQSCLRNFISTLIGIIPYVGWLIEPIMAIAADDGRKLGDKVAKTQVVDKKHYK